MRSVNEKLAVLTRIAETLNAENVCWAVGASVLLYFKGITDTFHDIDIMTAEEDADRVKALLDRMGTQEPPHRSEQFRSAAFWEFVIDGVEVDVIAGFKIVKDGAVHDCPFSRGSVPERVDCGGQSVPLHSVEAWRRYYELMDRPDKVKLIDAFYSR